MFDSQTLTNLRKDLENKTFTAEAGAGLVVVTMSGLYQVLDIKIDSSILDGPKPQGKDDLQFISDLTRAAVNAAVIKVSEYAATALINNTSRTTSYDAVPDKDIN